MNAAPKNRSLQAKSAARLAAVQMAYRMAMSGAAMSPEKLMHEYATFRAGDAAVKGEAPHSGLLNTLLSGLAEHGESLQKSVEAQLQSGWRADRVNPILLAILKLAIFEFDQCRQVKPPVIIDEYTSLAHKLLSEEEAAFVHATLKNLSTQLRA